MLTDLQLRRVRPGQKSCKLSDGNGLTLMVTKAGGKLWQFRYRFAGKEKTLSIGVYPSVSIAEARDARDQARKQLHDGKDPSAEKRLSKLARAVALDNDFESVARKWHEHQTTAWSQKHAKDVLDTLERDLFPKIGMLPIRDVAAPSLLAALRVIEARGAVETAHRVRQRAEAIFDFAAAHGLIELNPAKNMGAALQPVVRGQQAAVTDLDEARNILAAAEATPAHPSTQLALRFLALTVVRPGELRSSLWADFKRLDRSSPFWVIPAERMKMKRDHVVPLSKQAIEVLDALEPLTGRGTFLFPSTRSARKPMSENAIGYLLNRAGFHSRHVPHGWRSTFSTLMNERFRDDRSVIDLMLAHVKGDKTEAAYNRALHLERRAELAQEWANLLLANAPPAAKLARVSA